MKTNSDVKLSDYYPVETNDCFNIGISGNCDKKCDVLNSGSCKYFYPEKYTNVELNYYYDNGYYEKIIEDYLKSHTNEEKRRKAWDRALVNTRLECPDWQPDEEYMELVEKCIEGEITEDDIIKILIKKYKVEAL